MVSWRTRIFGESRSRILELLRDAPQTAVSLAERLGVTHNAVRQHLAGLGSHGLVEPAGVQRDTGGKPAQLYTLSATGEELFPKGYSAALISIIDEAEKQGAKAGDVRDLLRRTGKRMAKEVRIPAGKPELKARVELAAKALHKLGADMVAEETTDGWQLRGRGCPISAVVAERPVACELVRAFIGEVTCAEVGECGGHDEHGSCIFRIHCSAQVKQKGSASES